ncbi:MAG: hypothetical protein M9960_06825 [Xanthomonadaceae bacterium]|nr:hypothetical protein [Xanthomonadaceae bacterium]
MKHINAILAASLIYISSLPLYASESIQTASNGVEISVKSDDFADRYEYSAPAIKFGTISADNGAIFLARVKSAGTFTPVTIQGFIMYRGEWRRYSTAIFRGGETATLSNTQRKVVTCSSRPCVLSEYYIIHVTQEQIDKYTSDGKLEIQLRSQDANHFMISIPANYVQALLEVTNGN